MADTILRLPDVKARTGLSRSTIYARMSEGDFPQSVILGPRAVGWSESMINQWVDDRIASAEVGREVAR